MVYCLVEVDKGRLLVFLSSDERLFIKCAFKLVLMKVAPEQIELLTRVSLIENFVFYVSVVMVRA
jgi:hypothetical protein